LPATCQDISARKKIEDELMPQQRRLDLVLNSLPLVMYSTQAFGNYETTWVSGNVARVTGFKPVAFMKDYKLWARPDSYGRQERNLGRMPGGARDNNLSMEYRWQCSDGTTDGSWTIRLLRDSQGNPQESFGCWLDITERKQAERRQKNSEARLRQLWTYIPAAVYVKDRNGRFVMANRFTATVLDANGEVEGRSVVELSPNREQASDSLPMTLP